MLDRLTKFILILVLTAAVGVGGFLGYMRYQVETASKTVELAMDLRDIKTLSALSKYPMDKLLDAIKASGVKSIGILEQTLPEATTSGELLFMSGAGVLRQKNLNLVLSDLAQRKLISPSFSYVYCDNAEVRKRVQNQLHYVLPPQAFKNLGEKVFELAESEIILREVGIGISESQKRYLAKKGFSIIPRMSNDPRYDIPRKIADLVGYDTIIFDGEELPGYPDKVEFLGWALKKSRVKYGYVEIVKQDGDQKLKAMMGTEIVRVHSVPKDELLKIEKDEALVRFSRAVKERSIRLIYIRPFLPPQITEDPVKYNLEYLNDISTRIKSQGYELGKASGLTQFKPEGWQIMLLGLAAVIITLLLIDLFIPLSWWAIWPLLFASILGMMYVGAGSRGYPLEKFLALLVTCTTPAYAVISQLKSKNTENAQGHILIHAINVMLNIVAETFIGIFILIGLLAGTEFMLGAQTFVGVKTALIIPVILVAFYFLPKAKETYINLWNQKISVGYLIIGAVLALAGLFMLARSGNFTIPVPGIEKQLRGMLEAALMIRPRTKEFLIGYPALILAILLFLKGRKDWLWLWLAAGVIGPISLMNTFSHIHSPLLVSFLRSVIGVVLGVLIGGAAGAIYLRFINRSNT